MTSPVRRVGDMAWATWGDPDARTALPPAVRDLLTEFLGAPLTPVPSSAAEEVALPDPVLAEKATVALTAAVGTDGVRTDPEARLLRIGGKSTQDLLRRRAGEAARAPDAVVLPADHDQVLDVLAICADHQIAVVPFGGGTSVVGGVEPLRGRFRSVVALDLRRLDKLVSVDTEAMTATLQAGLRTPEAEELLAAHGLTLGHRPQSAQYATIGGYAATRSSGEASAGYGRFDDMVLAVKAATPRGTLEAGLAPSSAAGPDLRQLLLGSEGVFGVITEVTCRVHRLPAARHEEIWHFADWPSGVTALRGLAQAGALPAMARLSDGTETFVQEVLAEQATSGACQAVLGYEGTPDRVERERRTVREVFSAVTGASLPTSRARTTREATEPKVGSPSDPIPGADSGWRRSRTEGPYLRDALLDTGVLTETLETAAVWSRLTAVKEAVTEALTKALQDAGTPVVMCHVSHVYPTGASLYFTVAAAAGSDPARRWSRAKRAASDAISRGGGTITHHHAVGTDHLPWIRAEVGDLGVEVLRAVKSALDPSGILNPGKLIPS